MLWLRIYLISEIFSFSEIRTAYDELLTALLIKKFMHKRLCGEFIITEVKSYLV